MDSDSNLLNREERLPAFKLTIVQYVIAAILLVLLSGLWRLQVIGASNYRALAEQNRIRKVPILAPRGRLFDREGRLLVDNYPSVSCFIIREPGRDIRADFPMIARGLHMTPDQLEATMRHYVLAPKYEPIPLKQDITPDEVEFIESHRDELPELETIDEQRRLYPRNGFAANLIGYVGEVSDDMLNDPRYAYYEPGDVVGKSGVEQSYDQLLRGQDGSQDIIVDSHGKEVGILGREPAVPGQAPEADHRPGYSDAPRKRRSAIATARLSRSIPIPARFWPWFRGPRLIPTIFPSRSRAASGTSSSLTRATLYWIR